MPDGTRGRGGERRGKSQELAHEPVSADTLRVDLEQVTADFEGEATHLEEAVREFEDGLDGFDCDNALAQVERMGETLRKLVQKIDASAQYFREAIEVPDVATEDRWDAVLQRIEETRRVLRFYAEDLRAEQEEARVRGGLTEITDALRELRDAVKRYNDGGITPDKQREFFQYREAMFRDLEKLRADFHVGMEKWGKDARFTQDMQQLDGRFLQVREKLIALDEEMERHAAHNQQPSRRPPQNRPQQRRNGGQSRGR